MTVGDGVWWAETRSSIANGHGVGSFQIPWCCMRLDSQKERAALSGAGLVGFADHELSARRTHAADQDAGHATSCSQTHGFAESPGGPGRPCGSDHNLGAKSKVEGAGGSDTQSSCGRSNFEFRIEPAGLDLSVAKCLHHNANLFAVAQRLGESFRLSLGRPFPWRPCPS